MPRNFIWAICTRDPELTLWLVDTCAGGRFSAELALAKTWDEANAAWRELEACDIDTANLECVPIALESLR